MLLNIYIKSLIMIAYVLMTIVVIVRVEIYENIVITQTLKKIRIVERARLIMTPWQQRHNNTHINKIT